MSDVYFNLHKHVWSVRTKGKVKHHVDIVVFNEGANFVVQPAGRKKVLEEKRKNVHAFVRGDVTIISADLKKWQKYVADINTRLVSYNPYKADHFYYVDNGEEVESAEEVIMIVDNGKPFVYVPVAQW